MYGDLAEKLVLEARRAQNLDHLPQYNSSVVRAITRETKDLALLANDLPLEEQYKALIGVLNLAQFRNKRCLLAYHHQRLTKIESKLWQDQEIHELGNLSPFEQQYIRQFGELLVDVKEVFDEIDLTGSLDPPRDIYVEVRCLKTAGEIQTEYGVFDLSKNSQFYVRKSDVQRLIQQGLVELVDRYA